MELTASQWIMAAFAFVIGTVVAMVLDEFLRKRDVPPVPRGLMDALAFVGVSVLIAGMLVAPIGEALGLAKPPAPTPTPPPTVPGPAGQNIGYVMATVRDRFAPKKPYLKDATVGVYLTQPSPGAPSYAIQTKLTDAYGGAFFELPGLTSGTVYLMASMDGYYSDVKSTTIPGPQVYPTEALWAKFELAKVGQLSGVVENLTPNITITDTEISLDSTSEEQRIKVTLRNSASGTGIKDLVIQFTRGSAWRANSPSISVDVSAPSGITVSTDGDLNTGYVQTVRMTGFLTGTARIEVMVSVSLSTPASGELLIFAIDDLGEIDGVGYAGEGGIPTVSGKILVP